MLNWLIFGIFRQKVVRGEKRMGKILKRKVLREGEIHKENLRKGQSRFVWFQGRLKWERAGKSELEQARTGKSR